METQSGGDNSNSNFELLKQIDELIELIESTLGDLRLYKAQIELECKEKNDANRQN